jgi:hypothetical protein
VIRGTLLFIAALFCLTSCVATEPRPPGVPRSILFFVTPLYPHSFEITAHGSRGTAAEVLKDAWRKKALMTAAGHRFNATELVVHDSETVPSGGLPMQRRIVTGTITLLD